MKQEHFRKDEFTQVREALGRLEAGQTAFFNGIPITVGDPGGSCAQCVFSNTDLTCQFPAPAPCQYLPSVGLVTRNFIVRKKSGVQIDDPRIHIRR